VADECAEIHVGRFRIEGVQREQFTNVYPAPRKTRSDLEVVKLRFSNEIARKSALFARTKNDGRKWLSFNHFQRITLKSKSADLVFTDSRIQWPTPPGLSC
jgi:hypothetical protein